MQWELTNDRPLYIQLTEQLKRLILSGEYSPGEPFPSVRELATSANKHDAAGTFRIGTGGAVDHRANRRTAYYQ